MVGFTGCVLSKYTRTGPFLCYTGEEKADWNEQGVILGNPRKRKSVFCIYSIKKCFFYVLSEYFVLRFAIMEICIASG